MVRAWAGRNFVRRVPAHLTAGQVSGRHPSRARSCPCIGRPGSRRPNEPQPTPNNQLLVVTCFAVDPTDATQTRFVSRFDSRPVFQLSSAPRLKAPSALPGLGETPFPGGEGSG